MSAEPWYPIGKHDVFPEQFPRFLGLTADDRTLEYRSFGWNSPQIVTLMPFVTMFSAALAPSGTYPPGLVVAQLGQRQVLVGNVLEELLERFRRKLRATG